jgi:hypothetical protein
MMAAAAALLAGAINARPAHAALSAVGPVNPATAFPDWFQDSTGLKVQLCLDGPPFCLAAKADMVAPDGEAFWFEAESVVPVGASGEARLILAQEAAYSNTDPIGFGRTRIVVRGATPNTTYTFNHPYGTATIDTDGLGNGRFNEDIGCLGPPCGWATALASKVSPQFLRWSAAAPAPPAGFIGDAVTPHPVTGGSVRNTFGVAGGASTGLFTVQGKLAGPPVPVFEAPGATDFGNSPVGAPVQRTITVSSFGVPDAGGASNLAMNVVAVSGPNAAEFPVVANGCSSHIMVSGQTCSVTVQFTPAAPGVKQASLDFGHNGAGGASHVALSGGGTPPVAAAVAGASAASRLAISRLRTTHRMSRARVLQRGLRFSMRLPANTEILKIAVYRVRSGKIVRKPVWLGFRVVGRVSRSGLYRVRLDSRALRSRLKAGLYQVNVTPGLSKRQLGRTSTTRLRITRR